MYTNRYASFSFTSIVAASLLAVACGGNVDNGNGNPSDSGVQQETSNSVDKKFSAMSDSELTAYCTEMSKSFDTKLTADEQHRIGCGFAGVFGTMGATTDLEAQKKCKSAYDACMAEPFTPEPSTGDCSDFATKAKSCGDLTTAEVNGCTDEQFAMLKKFAAPDLCSTVKMGDTAATPTSPKCEIVKAKCPTLFDDSKSGGGTPG